MAIAKVILNGEVQMDVTSDTVEANKLLEGETATKNDGTKVTGTFVAPDPVISALSVTPTESAQTFNEGSISGYKPVTVGAIASDYIGSAIPMRSAADMYVNGSRVYAPSGYYSTAANAAVSSTSLSAITMAIISSTGNVTAELSYSAGYLTADGKKAGNKALPTLSASTWTPGSTSQTISSYRWLTGSQTIAAISSTYVGTGVPLISRGTWSKTAISERITGWARQYISCALSSGYLATDSTFTYTNDIPAVSGRTIIPTETSQLAVANSKYTLGSVYVDAIPSSYIIPSGTYSVTENGTYDIGSYASVDVSVAGGGGDENAFIMRSFSSTVYENSTLTKIGPGAFAAVGTLSAVSVPNVTEIGAMAFAHNRLNIMSFKSLFNFSAVTSIGLGAFIDGFYRSGTNTGSVDIFPEVTHIGSYAFAETRIDGGYFPKAVSLGEGCFGGCRWIPTMPTLSEIPAYCFVNTQTDIIYSDMLPNVETIGPYAFVSIYNNGMGEMYVIRYNTGSSISSYISLYKNQFSDNSYLSHVTFPNVKTISSGAFSRCRALDYISFPLCETIGNAAFSACKLLKSVNFPNCTSIAAYAFNSCTALSSISFPVCEKIGGGAFDSCTSLITADFPLCTTVGFNAFNGCTSLSSISFPNCVSVDYLAFYKCSKITSAIFPECKTLGYNAFVSCTSLITADFPLCESINSGTFSSCTHLTTANFPECEIIGPSAFYGCFSLNTVTIPKCSSIAFDAFRECTSLSSIDLSNVQFIGARAFSGCRKLYYTDLVLNECGVIGQSAFNNAEGLYRLYLPKCSIISSGAFAYCGHLDMLYVLSSSVVSLGTSVFYRTPMTSSETAAGHFGHILVPSSLYEMYISATNWSDVSARIVSLTDEDIAALPL